MSGVTKRKRAPRSASGRRGPGRSRQPVPSGPCRQPASASRMAKRRGVLSRSPPSTKRPPSASSAGQTALERPGSARQWGTSRGGNAPGKAAEARRSSRRAENSTSPRASVTRRMLPSGFSGSTWLRMLGATPRPRPRMRTATFSSIRSRTTRALLVCSGRGSLRVTVTPSTTSHRSGRPCRKTRSSSPAAASRGRTESAPSLLASRGTNRSSKPSGIQSRQKRLSPGARLRSTRGASLRASPARSPPFLPSSRRSSRDSSRTSSKVVRMATRPLMAPAEAPVTSFRSGPASARPRRLQQVLQRARLVGPQRDPATDGEREGNRARRRRRSGLRRAGGLLARGRGERQREGGEERGHSIGPSRARRAPGGDRIAV